MPSQQHEQWKQDLFDHLDRKLSGCVSCEFGESRDPLPLSPTGVVSWRGSSTWSAWFQTITGPPTLPRARRSTRPSRRSPPQARPSTHYGYGRRQGNGVLHSTNRVVSVPLLDTC